MSKGELKPCPFCGNKALVWRTDHRTYIECCNYSTLTHQVCVSAETDKEAIEAWNRRAENEHR